MANHNIVTRFAPSPTGYLHLGSARTALFCWLFARHHHGQFILRIEDTDQERSTEEAIAVILKAMEWLGLDYDEGPVHQTQRHDRYQQALQQLLQSGKAYRCDCSIERLGQLRQQQRARGDKPRYDGRCRDADHVNPKQPHVLRFYHPQTGTLTFEDQIHGPITISNEELDDFVIARTDGTPTYNLAAAVDDWDMNITDVIRGNDHINNTPRQINLLQALGATPPRYTHLPMILGSDKKKLSKRHGAVSLLQFQAEGYLPEALINYLARLGWSHGNQEIFSLKELIEYFNLDHISQSPAMFNHEKLAWLNQHYLKTLDPQSLVQPLAAQLKQLELSYENGPSLTSILSLQAERNTTLKEIAENSRYFFKDPQPSEYQPKAARKHLTTAALPGLMAVRDKLNAITQWDKPSLHQVIVEVIETLHLTLGQLAQSIRVAMTGGTISPPIDATLEQIGRAAVLKRLAQAIDYIQQNNLSSG